MMVEEWRRMRFGWFYRFFLDVLLWFCGVCLCLLCYVCFLCVCCGFSVIVFAVWV